jgi:hypothetical protein
LAQAGAYRRPRRHSVDSCRPPGGRRCRRRRDRNCGSGNFVPLAVWISGSSARRTPPLRCGRTPATNRAVFLSCAKLGVGRISPPRNGSMRSSKAWAWVRLAMANIPSRHVAAPTPRMICRRVVIISAAVGWRSREVYTVCPLVCAFTTKAFALLGSTTILAARRCRRQLAPRSWL